MSSKLHVDIFQPEIDSTESTINIPLFATAVSAGFPSPSDDYFQSAIDLNRELIRNPAATFYARVSGISMINDGVDDGDLLVIDKSVTPFDGCLAVCFIDGAFTLKRVKMVKECIWLLPANPDYPQIQVTPDCQFAIWGVVRYLIKKI